MRVVYKYAFDNIWEPLIIDVPADHKVVHVDYQGDTLTVWVELDPDQPKHYKVVLLVYGTGHPNIDVFSDHVATVQRNGLVWHIYKKEIPG